METKISEKDRLKKALSAITTVFDAEVILYNGPINEDGYGKLVKAASSIESSKRLILFLTTYGGSADSAYRIARYAQNYFEKFLLFVPSSCKSAGTLIALGASEIYMSPYGEFGPLDVQVFKADEIFERRSGLLSKSAVWSLTEEAFRIFEQVLLGIKMRSGGTVSFKVSSNVAASITSGLLSPVMAQLDPLAIGEDYQNLHIAQEYGQRLVQKYGVIDEDVVTALVENYPSHGFVIDLFEASKLFGNVKMANAELMELQGLMPEETVHPKLRDVIVTHVRELIGDEDDEIEPEVGDPDTNRSDRTQEEDKPVYSCDRESTTGTGEGRAGNGENSPSSRNEQAT